MDHRQLGRTGLSCSRLGWGAFKIGRNTGTKFSRDYDLPSAAEAEAIIDSMLELGITLIDTAPSYGLSEERLGVALRNRREQVTLVGEP